MSGGVDSSVAAMLLASQGHEVIGVSMQVWDYRRSGGCDSRKTCCSPDDFTDARKVAARFNIPYYVFDFEDTFRREVIDNFVKTYQIGKTPNPCIDCNSKVKFRELRDRARSFRSDAVATGHYAQISRDESGYHLLRGAFRDKDQSYFLYGALQDELAETLFPVGHMTKAEVRELARSYGIETAEKPESQDICFVSGTVGDFINRAGAAAPAGAMLLKDGRKVGEHAGLHNFTVGQRRGIGVGGSDEPLYVVEIDPVRNAVILGTKRDLERPSFQVEQCNWVAPEYLAKTAPWTGPFSFKGNVQVRSRHLGSPAEVTVTSPTTATVTFLSDPATVSPGQAGVFYDQDNRELLGGGRIV